jgi:hypothetical protein
MANMKLINHQRELEKLFNKNQLIPRIKAEFMNCTAFDFVEYIQDNGIPIAFGLDLLVQMQLHKRIQLPALVGIMNKHFDDPQQTTDMLYHCMKIDLLDWHSDLKVFIVKFTISQEVQDELDRFQFPLPMVVMPKLVKSNRDTGYYTSLGSIILKKNHHDNDVCLDHINRLNKTKFVINSDVANMVKNQWRNLDKAKEGETRDDFEKRKRAFEKYDRTSRDVIKLIQQEGEHFHLTHKYDKRGRTYCQGYHINYQGAPWNKAVVHFADAEEVV